MPFPTILLNDGRKIPQIGFGTWKIPKEVCVGQVDQAIDLGFDHVDSAQGYRNEEEVGIAFKDSGLSRSEVWITTKWSTDTKTARESCEDSLQKLGVEYIDLYLIHGPWVFKDDIPGTWKQMEELHREGKVKSIGVSNYSVDNLKELLASCSIKPVVNQILLHPYVIKETVPLLEFMAEQHIVPEAYSVLIPLTSRPGGPVDKPVQKIADRLSVKPEQVLLAWAKAKRAIIVTTSSKKERLQGYLDVGDFDLTDSDVAAIDKAGVKGALWNERKAVALRFGKVAVGALAGYAVVKALLA